MGILTCNHNQCFEQSCYYYFIIIIYFLFFFLFFVVVVVVVFFCFFFFPNDFFQFLQQNKSLRVRLGACKTGLSPPVTLCY